jgi:SNF family Na+-dependent transporter
MLWIVATVVIGAVILFALFRVGRSTGLDSLGAVSQRWIANERASSHDGLR